MPDFMKSERAELATFPGVTTVAIDSGNGESSLTCYQEKKKQTYHIVGLGRVRLYGIFRYNKQFWFKCVENGARSMPTKYSWGPIAHFQGNEKVACFPSDLKRERRKVKIKVNYF